MVSSRQENKDGCDILEDDIAILPPESKQFYNTDKEDSINSNIEVDSDR